MKITLLFGIFNMNVAILGKPNPFGWAALGKEKPFPVDSKTLFCGKQLIYLLRNDIDIGRVLNTLTVDEHRWSALN